MSWFSILKKRNRPAAQQKIAKKVRRVARPFINEAVENFLADKNEVTMSELRNIVKESTSNLRTHPDLQDLNPTQRGRYLTEEKGAFLSIATYKTRELGFILQPAKTRLGKKQESKYIRGE